MSVTLLLGGVASGKSRLAAGRIGAGTSPAFLIATAEAGDEEMAEKIERHRRARPPGWTVIEEPRDLVSALGRVPDDAGLVVDCLTLWVANLAGAGLGEDEILGGAEDAAALVAARPGETVVVSNEVGSGIVPANASARGYRQLLGRVNSIWAAHSRRVFLVVAGGLVPVRPEGEVWDGS